MEVFCKNCKRLGWSREGLVFKTEVPICYESFETKHKDPVGGEIVYSRLIPVGRCAEKNKNYDCSEYEEVFSE